MPIDKTDSYKREYGAALDFWSVRSDVGSRDNIPMIVRYAGMEVYVRSENRFYLWPQGASANTDWQPRSYPSGSNTVHWATTVPDGSFGNDGDLYFREQGETIDLYQKESGDWGTPLGSFPKASGVSIIQNDAVSYMDTTGSWLDSTYPESKEGDVVWSETNMVAFTKYADGKWRVDNIEIK